MECNELLAVLTLGAIASYLAEAAIRWIKGGVAHASRTGAHEWCARTRN